MNFGFGFNTDLDGVRVFGELSGGAYTNVMEMAVIGDWVYLGRADPEMGQPVQQRPRTETLYSIATKPVLCCMALKRGWVVAVGTYSKSIRR